MSFGPIDENGEINYVVKVFHLDINKVFSTILLFTLTFLQNNPSKMIGIDGSNDIRAYLYHRMFLTNYHYLQNYFITIGVDWYVRLLRNGEVEKDQDDNPFFLIITVCCDA